MFYSCLASLSRICGRVGWWLASLHNQGSRMSSTAGMPCWLRNKTEQNCWQGFLARWVTSLALQMKTAPGWNLCSSTTASWDAVFWDLPTCCELCPASLSLADSPSDSCEAVHKEASQKHPTSWRSWMFTLGSSFLTGETVGLLQCSISLGKGWCNHSKTTPSNAVFHNFCGPRGCFSFNPRSQDLHKDVLSMDSC